MTFSESQDVQDCAGASSHMRDSAMIAAATELHVAAYQHFGLENDGLWSSDANDKDIIG